jgi:1D-myo-inositol-triphosphate 3-kinase
LILKPLNAAELQAYQRLATDYVDDPVHAFVPGFHGVQHDTGEEGLTFLCLDNLLHGFKQPKVMDVKLGMRTHLFSEMQNEKPRGDLFKKMLLGFPSQLTPAELDMQMVTKSRYMMARDANSTSRSLGYRVSGTAGSYGGPGETSKYSVTVSETQDAAHQALRVFARSASDDHEENTACPAKIAEALIDQLHLLRSAFETSGFVRDHECVGTSVLIVVDASSGHCRAFWIDLAKTCVCADGSGLSHREPLSDESQEEGLLVGLDNLISAWEHVKQSFEEETQLFDEGYRHSCCRQIVSHNKAHVMHGFRCFRTMLQNLYADSPLLKAMK